MMAQTIVNALFSGLLLGLVAAGFSISYGTARCFQVANTATFLGVADVGILVLNRIDAPIALAALASIIAAAVVGLIIEIAIYRPLRRFHSSSLVLFLASLAVLVIVQHLIGLIIGSE